MTVHQLKKALSVAIHTEAIGEGQSDLSAGGTTSLRGRDEGPLGCRAVPELPLEIEHFRLLHHREVEILRFKLR